MTLVLNLPPELEQRLGQEAQRQGLSTAECAIKVLNQHLPAEDRREQLLALLETWMKEDEDDDEQRETGEYLIRVLDEDRTSYRRLFPPELKGVSW